MKFDLKKKIQWKKDKYIPEPSICFLVLGMNYVARYQKYVEKLDENEREDLFMLLKSYVKSTGRVYLLGISAACVLGIIHIGWECIAYGAQLVYTEASANADEIFDAMCLVGITFMVFALFIAMVIYFRDFSKQCRYTILKNIVEGKKKKLCNA